MNGDRPGPPRGVPTLTEVVNWPAFGAGPAPAGGESPESPAAPDDSPADEPLSQDAPPGESLLVAGTSQPPSAMQPDPPPVSRPEPQSATASQALPVVPAWAASPLPIDEQITQRVLADLQRQIDLMLDYRLREMLTPLLARAADSLVRDTRHELASTLREIVERAVAQELARHRGR